MENKWLEYCLSQKENVKRRWREMMHRDLDLENPKTLTEKIQWLKIYDSNLLKTYCSDKITVRDYCKEKLGQDYFIPILAVYNKFDEIDFSKLPKDYVLKTNHGSHTNIIVRDGKINKELARRNFNDWMSKDWSWWGYELAYKPIPRKIFIEQYMNDGHTDLIDYKFLCFNGEPKYCQVMTDRHKSSFHTNYYNMNFEPQLNISRNDIPANYSVKDKKPKNWELMKETAKKLSEDFNFVRVDLYEIDDKMYISELTFFPAAGYVNYKNKDTDLKLGNMLQL